MVELTSAEILNEAYKSAEILDSLKKEGLEYLRLYHIIYDHLELLKEEIEESHKMDLRREETI